MVNSNGQIVEGRNSLSSNNRAFELGDGVFETLKVVNGKILYFEDHYFRFMSAMRIVRMEIPMNFTIEYLESQIIATVEANGSTDSARVRMTVYRNSGGRYLSETNTISYLIDSSDAAKYYQADGLGYEVDLYKDFYVTRHLLSTIKTTNRILNITASIYASENGLDNCLLINDAKNVIEATNGNLFMKSGNTIITPPISEGCMNGVMRKQIIALLNNDERFDLIEEPISPFDLQKADELFLTNVITGVQSITKYRKKEYSNALALEIIANFNKTIELF